MLRPEGGTFTTPALTAATKTSTAKAILCRQYRYPPSGDEGTPPGVPPSSRFGKLMSGASAPPPPAGDPGRPKDDRGKSDAQEHDWGG